MKKNKKYDIIIYGSLVLAFIFVCLSYWDNIVNPTDKSLSYSLKDESTEETTEYEETDSEPTELVDFDKKGIVQKYLDSVLDRITTDTIISYEMITSWDTYEVLDMKYERKIAEDYYAYTVDIKINNLEANIPTNKNEELSTEEYLVVTLNANIIYSESQNGYLVKKIDIPASN